MLREIIRPTSENYNIHIPKEYINTEVEILVLPLNSLDNKENYEFWSDKEIDNIGKIAYGLSSNDFEDDDEDYNKW